VLFVFSAPVYADEVGRLSCEQAHIDALQGADKAAVVQFVNATRPQQVEEILPIQVAEFGWAAVVGGLHDLLVLFDFSERGYTNRLWVYSCNRVGELSIQEIEGWKLGNFKEMVRDLNGDGEDELIIPTALPENGVWSPLVNIPAWPAVYRFEKGKYVDASRDFPSFYDNEVLPELDKEIGKGRNQDDSAVQALARNKILRVLGRDPVAGVQQAYQWMKSDDSQVLQCAIATFADVGGHEKEVRELQQALPAAEKREMESRKGG
jgi:hypothetical protein